MALELGSGWPQAGPATMTRIIRMPAGRAIALERIVRIDRPEIIRDILEN
jgi:hypothetical protein